MNISKQVLLLITLWLCVCETAPGYADSASKSISPKLIHGSVSESELIDNLERVGIKCIFHEAATKGYLAVDSVRMGSSAFYKGVAVGDRIKGLVTSNDVFTLSIERDGQPYQVVLKVLTPSLASAPSLKAGAQHSDKNLPIPVVDVSQNKIPIEDVSDKKKEREKKLIQYDIELIIDITGSMQFVDGTDGLTKFQWCHEQVRNLAQLLGEYQKTFTITTFNETHKTETNCNANRIEEIYGTIKPVGGTDLVDPLMDRLEYAIEHKTPGKATVIAVITDGMPNIPKDPRVLNRALVDFTKKLSKGDEVVVTFLQIGDTFDGRSFCIDLDDNLIDQGAKFDIVDTKTFSELKSEGLTSALVDAITEKWSVGHRVLKHTGVHMSQQDKNKVDAADGKLREKMDERQALEKILHISKPEK